MINTKDLDPSADLARYRTSVSRLFVVLSWLLVPALSAVAGSSHFRTQWSVTAAAFALASAATAAMLVGGSRTWPRLVIAVVLTGMAGIFVNVASEPWQVDYHMVLFAALAMLAAYADWRPVAAMWRVSVAYLLFAAGYIAYITFLSAYLTAHQASVTQVAVTWAALGVAAMAEPVLWSRPLRAWPGARSLATALAALSAAAAVAIISADPAVVIVSAIGYGVSFLVVPAAITGLVHAAVPRPNWTAALAAFTVVFAVGQMAGPYLAGLLADSYGAGATLVWTAALCAAGSVASLTVRSAGKP